MAREELDRRLALVRTTLSDLAHLDDDLLDRAMMSVATGDPYHARMAQSRDEALETLSSGIEEQAFDILSLQQPVLLNDLRFVVGTLVVAQRLQRVGHGALGIAELAVTIATMPVHETPPAELLTLGQDARAMLQDSVNAMINEDIALAEQVVTRDTTVDAAYREMRDALLVRLGQLTVSPEDPAHRRLTYWVWIAHKLERVADHSVSIARRAQQLKTA
jgi:phosphate transport system protein